MSRTPASLWQVLPEVSIHWCMIGWFWLEDTSSDAFRLVRKTVIQITFARDGQPSLAYHMSSAAQCEFLFALQLPLVACELRHRSSWAMKIRIKLLVPVDDEKMSCNIGPVRGIRRELRLLVRYSKPGLLGTEQGAVISKVRRSGIDRVTRRFPVDPLTAISRKNKKKKGGGGVPDGPGCKPQHPTIMPQAVGNELHCVFDCPHFSDIRAQFSGLFQDAAGCMRMFMRHKDRKSVCDCLIALLQKAQT